MIGHPYSRPEESTGFLLQKATQSWERRLDGVLRPHNLTLMQFQLLTGIRWLAETDEAPITQNQLAMHLNIDRMMTSQVLRRLERRGLVSRVPSQHDRRSNLLSLTLEGEETLSVVLPIVMRTDALFFIQLAQDEAELRRHLLTLNSKHTY